MNLMSYTPDIILPDEPNRAKPASKIRVDGWSLHRAISDLARLAFPTRGDDMHVLVVALPRKQADALQRRLGDNLAVETQKILMTLAKQIDDAS